MFNQEPLWTFIHVNNSHYISSTERTWTRNRKWHLNAKTIIKLDSYYEMKDDPWSSSNRLAHDKLKAIFTIVSFPSHLSPYKFYSFFFFFSFRLRLFSFFKTSRQWFRIICVSILYSCEYLYAHAAIPQNRYLYVDLGQPLFSVSSPGERSFLAVWSRCPKKKTEKKERKKVQDDVENPL